MVNERITLPGNLKRVEKPWGYEIWWAATDNYVAKFIQINANSRLSLQYHQKKEETFYVMKGTLFVWEDPAGKDKPIKLAYGCTYHVKPGHVHRFGAGKQPVMVCEVSTAHIKDIMRLDDDYKRSSSEIDE